MFQRTTPVDLSSALSLSSTISSMKKPNHRHPPTPAPAESPPSFFSNTVLYGMLAVLGALLGYAGWQYYNERQPPEPVVYQAAPAASSSAVSATPAVTTDPQKLRGQWVRTDSDGNYMLGIMSITEDGKLQAAYMNPKPINVAKAELTKLNGEFRVFVELRDVNYPGSTYELRYDAAMDQLVGEYFQATQQQRFPVVFERAR
jgi:hypothetical protein